MADLTRRRKRVMDALLAAQPELGHQLQRLDAAIEALGGPGGPGPTGAPRRRRRPAEGSVRDKAQKLLDSENRTWTYDQIIERYKQMGDAIEAENPKAALRTALGAMVKAGDAFRVAEGMFRSAKFAPASLAEASGLSLANGSRGGDDEND